MFFFVKSFARMAIVCISQNETYGIMTCYHRRWIHLANVFLLMNEAYLL